MSYLTNFYTTGKMYPSKQTVGASNKGFNDTLASSGSGRIMVQQCGKTWISTFGKINSLHNSSTQLPLLQLVIWNDYEECTEDSGQAWELWKGDPSRVVSCVPSCLSLGAELTLSGASL